MIWLLLIIVVIYWIYNNPIFGSLPTQKEKERFINIPHYKNGQFHNLEPTPSLAEGHSMPKMLVDFLFKKYPNTIPSQPIPTIQQDWNQLDLSKDAYYWFGHSSYLLVLGGKTFLIDPVLSAHASPIPSFNKVFPGTNCVHPEELPNIDFLIITHDHYDHLDYPTIKALKPKISKVICGLAVGAHFRKWRYNRDIIHELNWYDSMNLFEEASITATPARHFSGRGMKRNTSLFCSYVLKVGTHNIFIGGDSGYGSHMKQIGQQYGPFDIAILENGQYNAAWKYIHTLPEELPQVIDDLKAKTVISVHNSKFKLAHHDWKEPLETITKLQSENVNIITPKIGEQVLLKELKSSQEKWWQHI